MKLSVNVAPKSSRHGIAGWLGDALQIRLRAPAERGKANESIARILVKVLSVRTKSVWIVAGHASPQKVMEIEGLSKAESLRWLG